MSDNPLVTVVIPFYSNIQGLLKNSVNSALSQTYKNLEVIVVDDASPVYAKDELSIINDPRLRIVRHEKNMNGAIARNTGIENARGEFIAFLDYDDIWYEDKIRQQYNLFEKLGDNESNVIYSRCKVVFKNRNYIRPKRSIKTTESVAHYLFCAKEIIQTSGIFLKATVARKVKFDDLKRHQDYQFCLSLERIGCSFHLLETVQYEFIQIPKVNDFNHSIFWFEKYLYSTSNKEKKCFILSVVIRSMISQADFNKSLSIVREYQISYLKFLKVVLVLKIKKLVKKITL